MPVQVYPLWVGPEFKTEVWISEQAEDLLNEHRKRDQGAFAKKLKRYAQSGFLPHWVGRGRPISPEAKRVLRIGEDRFVFRLYGFFGKQDGTKFIITGADDSHSYGKGGRSQQRVDDAASIRDSKDGWIETERSDG